jgi:hypothetical protein
MNDKAIIQKLILEILTSNSIEVKRTKQNEVVGLFKDSKLVSHTPVAIKLNAALGLREVIDNFITHDSPSTKDALQNMYSFISQLLPDEVKVEEKV